MRPLKHFAPVLMGVLAFVAIISPALVSKPARAEISKLTANFYDGNWALKILQTFPIKLYQANDRQERLGPIPSEVQKTYPEMVRTDAKGQLEVFGAPNPWLIVKAIQELYLGQQQHETAIQDLRALKYGRPVRMPGLDALVGGPSVSSPTVTPVVQTVSATPPATPPATTQAKTQNKETIDALTRRIVFLEKIVRENKLKGMRPWPLPHKLPVKDVHHG